jgi:hypothetical protein
MRSSPAINLTWYINGEPVRYKLAFCSSLITVINTYYPFFPSRLSDIFLSSIRLPKTLTSWKRPCSASISSSRRSTFERAISSSNVPPHWRLSIGRATKLPQSRIALSITNVCSPLKFIWTATAHRHRHQLSPFTFVVCLNTFNLMSKNFR